jgi:hypothetical protein
MVLLTFSDCRHRSFNTVQFLLLTSIVLACSSLRIRIVLACSSLRIRIVCACSSFKWR